MKYTAKYYNMFSFFLKGPMTRRFGRKSASQSIKRGKMIYRDMIEKTEDVGADNPMAGNIYMGYVLMAICRAGDYPIKEFSEVTAEFIRSKLVKKLMGGKDLNRSEDMEKMRVKMRAMAKWVEDHPEYKEKTWDFNFDESRHKDGFYYHFTRCPMEKFARENGYLDVLPIGCNTDYLTCELNHGVLHRQSTLAEGGDICDYWIVGDKVKNPQ